MAVDVQKSAVLGAERAINGAVMMGVDAVETVLEIGLTADDFLTERQGAIYAAAVRVHRSGSRVDEVTVADELESKGMLARVGGRAGLYELTEETPSALNVGEYARVVMRSSLKRQVASMSMEAHRMATDGRTGGEAALRWLQERIFSLGDVAEGRRGLVAALDVVSQVMKEVSERAEGREVGLRTAIRDLDRYLLGLRNGEVYIFAGRPSMGKSAVATQIAMNVAGDGVPVALYSIEMSIPQVGLRMLCQEGRVDSSRIARGMMSQGDEERLMGAAGKVGDLPIYISDPAQLTDIELRDAARRAKHRYGIGLVAVDYLQLMDAQDGRGLNDVDRVTKISRQLKAMAKELDIPVIAVSQLSRGPEARPDKRPILSDLRSSGAVEQDACAVMLLYRDDYYYREKSEDKGTIEVNVAKNRYGPQGVVKMRWSGEYTRLDDLARFEMEE